MIEEFPQTVLFVDDDQALRVANAQTLELAGLSVKAHAGAEDALTGLTRDFDGVIVSDIRMPRIDGLELLSRVRAIDPDIPVILLTGHGDVATAVGALRDGAFDFLTKPFAADHLVASIQKGLGSRRLVLDNRRLRELAEVADQSGPLIGDSAIMVKLREAISQIGKADFDVLLEGETGTGKELVAILLHRSSARRGRPFVAVNCGALPEALAESELFGHEAGSLPHARLSRVGRLESANRGTLFLDEIDSMQPAVQVKILRVIEEREVMPVGADHPRALDIRIIAAAKRDLREAIDEGKFREDLFYRLNVIRLRIPPLRERKSDIPLLFAHFTAAAAEQIGREPPPLAGSARRYLIEHDWPGNVRELRNFAYRITLGLEDFRTRPEELGLSLPERMEQFEAALLRDALAASGGDIRSVLAALRIPRKTLYDKLARHRINPAEFRASAR
jgi:two-component system C4-dicarboxylate transport response regulator DctD